MRGRQWARLQAEDERVALAWYGEAFARTKRLQPLEQVLGSGDDFGYSEPDDMVEFLRSIQASGSTNMKIEELTEWPLQ